ncbi:MAG: hypothetical protein IPO92_13675 [Saprospiraceae bacterium]|nr:hypothetical protein [Saprospiraceae bacterium]
MEPIFKKLFSEIQINKALLSKKRRSVFWIHTRRRLIFKSDGALLYHINTSNGLQNNTILSLFEDMDKNVWLGLDKGIGKINMNDDMLVYFDHKGNLGTVYSSAILDSILYLAQIRVFIITTKTIKTLKIIWILDLLRAPKGKSGN